jgi:hypothetical protein
MHCNIHDIFYSQFYHQNDSAAIDTILMVTLLQEYHPEDDINSGRNMLGEKTVIEIYHRFCGAFCWQFMYYCCILLTFWGCSSVFSPVKHQSLFTLVSINSNI